MNRKSDPLSGGNKTLVLLKICTFLEELLDVWSTKTSKYPPSTPQRSLQSTVVSIFFSLSAANTHVATHIPQSVEYYSYFWYGMVSIVNLFMSSGDGDLVVFIGGINGMDWDRYYEISFTYFAAWIHIN